MAFDWRGFGTELTAECEWALARLGKRSSGERFYAVALHAVYSEHSVLSLPALAAAQEAGSAPNDGHFCGARWNPPDFSHPELSLRARPTRALETALTREATRLEEAHYERVLERYYMLLVRVARSLRSKASRLLPVSNDFVCYVHDEAKGAELARLTIPKARYARLLGGEGQHQGQLETLLQLPPAERAAFLVTRLGEYEGLDAEEAAGFLIELGEHAIPALLGQLAHREHGWDAARILGCIGVASRPVILALRKRAHQGAQP